jgi:hypothetical protein
MIAFDLVALFMKIFYVDFRKPKNKQQNACQAFLHFFENIFRHTTQCAEWLRKNNTIAMDMMAKPYILIAL